MANKNLNINMIEPNRYGPLSFRHHLRTAALIGILLQPGTLQAATDGTEASPQPPAILSLPPQTLQPQGKTKSLHSQVLDLPPIERICWFASDAGRWPADGNRMLPWVGGHDLKALLSGKPNPIVKTPGNEGFLALIQTGQTPGQKNTPPYLALLPIPGDNTMSWLRITDDGTIACETGTLGTEAVTISRPLPTMIYGRGETPFDACRDAWAQAEQIFRGTGKTAGAWWRDEKKYPEPFRYLGWCSWEQYKKNIDEPLLIEAARRIEQSPIPIRWMLVDDGFQQQQNFKLRSFAPHPKTFPSQWKNLFARRSEKLRWFGLWHCYHGLWNGIAPNNDMGDALNAGFAASGKALFPGKTEQDAQAFYNAYMNSVKQYGFDFVKIDVQCEYLKHMQGQPNPARMNRWCTTALEGACHSLRLPLLNCMAVGPVAPFHTRYSAITRCSIDYHFGNLNEAKSHIYQSFQNTLWMAHSVWPDHDMFHSSDPACSRLLAITKALSGAPIYLSDAPEDFRQETIMPFVLSDGLILRPLAPAIPTGGSSFINPFDTPQAYTVIAPLPNGAAIASSFNLNTKPGAQAEACITTDDYRLSRDMLARTRQPDSAADQPELVAYDPDAGICTPFTGSAKADVATASYTSRILVPANHGWAVIGRADKYLPPCTVSNIRATDSTLSFDMAEEGPVIVYSARTSPELAPPHNNIPVIRVGESTYKLDFPVGSRKASVTLKRTGRP